MKLTGTKHGDAANALLGFYSKEADELEKAGQFFMAAIALSFALETAVLAYLLVEFGGDNGGELKIPDNVNMTQLIEAANDLDVLSAPITNQSLVGGDDTAEPPKHVAKEVIDQVRLFRNLIHPARALKKNFDPRSFSAKDLEKFKAIYESVVRSLLYNL